MSRRKPTTTSRADLSREAREALGMSQSEFAELLGVPRPTVGRWEAGMRDPGALGEALLALLIASPRTSLRVLRERQRVSHQRGRSS